MDFIQSFNCLLVFASHMNLLEFRLLFSFSLFRVELLQLVSKFLSLFFFWYSMSSLFFLISFIDIDQMFIILLGFLLFLLQLVLLVAFYLFYGSFNFIIIKGSGFDIFLLFFSIEVQLILWLLDRVINMLLLFWIITAILNATWLTIIDLEPFFGSSRKWGKST